jgi:adenylate cyclase
VDRSILCKGCWSQMRIPIALRGPLAIPFKVAGIRASRMNPNVCTVCERHFSAVKKAKQIVTRATVLFADVRGYTGLSQTLDATVVTQMLGEFYEHCAQEVWAADGIINKLIGDAVLAVYNFPIAQEDHVEHAVQSAIGLQKRCAGLRAVSPDGDEDIGVGVGIHTGDISIGEIGDFCRDFTAIGPAVNLAARLQTAAAPGEVLLSADAYACVAASYPGIEPEELALKGIDDPVTGFRIAA